MQGNTERPCVLAVVLDMNAAEWGKRHLRQEEFERNRQTQSELTFPQAVEQLLVFANAFLSLRPTNRLVFTVAHHTCARTVFPPPGEGVLASTTPAKIREHVINGIKQITTNAQNHSNTEGNGNHVNGETSGTTDPTVTLLSAALSMSLCHLRRVSEESVVRVETRILVVNISQDPAPQYIPIMNCVFSAQKIGAFVDVLLVSERRSPFFQQAAHVTGGLYFHLKEHPAGFLQYLLTLFLCDRATRQQLTLPTHQQVDFQATCCCHKNIVDQAFVCSVCLSIFCLEYVTKSRCCTCGTRFALNAPKRMPGFMAQQSEQTPSQQQQQQPQTTSTTPTKLGHHFALPSFGRGK